MAERLELVRSFEELRAGMLLVFKPCDWCGATHRGIIATWVERRPTLADEKGTVDREASGWGVLPAPSCTKLPTLVCTDDPLVNVYRVVDLALESSDSSHHSTPKKQPARVR